jgi:hypothetical protein
MYRNFTHPFLRPLMRMLLFRLTREVNALPRPQDPPNGHASGLDPDRILLFGSGPVVGYGVLSHDLALPGQLARQVSAATGRGADVDVVADADLVAQNALERVRAVELWRYDAIVIAIGANNSLLLTSVAIWRREMEALLAYLDDTVPSGTGIYLVAVPPISSIDVFGGAMGWLAERHANRLNAETRRIVSRLDQVTFVPFSPLVKADWTRYRSAATYQQWASVIAAPLITDLRRHIHERPAMARSDEASRLRALESTGVLDSASEERFTRIAQLGHQLFATDQTLISFVDSDRLFVKAASSGEPMDVPAMPRVGSFADWAIRHSGAFVVEDASQDPRFAQHPSVLDPEINLRFYAAYPIESSFGERVGVVSLLAREPRTWRENESLLLRDLALLVQRELG